MQLGALPEQLQEALLTISDPLRREQYLDFLKKRMFRQTLLVHETPRSHARRARSGSPRSRCSGRCAGAPTRTARRLTFVGAGGAHLTNDHPL